MRGIAVNSWMVGNPSLIGMVECLPVIVPEVSLSGCGEVTSTVLDYSSIEEIDAGNRFFRYLEEYCQTTRARVNLSFPQARSHIMVQELAIA